MSRVSVLSAPLAVRFSRFLEVTVHLLLWGGAASLCWRCRVADHGSFLSGLALLFCFLVISFFAYFLRELNRPRKVDGKSSPLNAHADFITRHWATIFPVTVSGFLFFPLFHRGAAFLFFLFVVGEVLCCRKIPTYADRFFQKIRSFDFSLSKENVSPVFSSDSVAPISFPTVDSIGAEQELTMENTDEEEEQEEEFEPDLLFAQTRRKTADGREALEGWVHPQFELFQEVSVVYIPFTPAFRDVPSLDLFPIAGEVKLTATQIEPYGVRIEVKRALSRNEAGAADNIVVGDFDGDSIRFGFYVEGEPL